MALIESHPTDWVITYVIRSTHVHRTLFEVKLNLWTLLVFIFIISQVLKL